jgi:hypothetical protein
MLVCAPVTIHQHLRVGFHLKQLPSNLTPLGVVQPWQFSQDFRFAHEERLRVVLSNRKGHRKGQLKEWRVMGDRCRTEFFENQYQRLRGGELGDAKGVIHISPESH